MLEVNSLKKRFKADSNTQDNEGIRDVREDGRILLAFGGILLTLKGATRDDCTCSIWFFFNS